MLSANCLKPSSAEHSSQVKASWLPPRSVSLSRPLSIRTCWAWCESQLLPTVVSCVNPTGRRYRVECPLLVIRVLNFSAESFYRILMLEVWLTEMFHTVRVTDIYSELSCRAHWICFTTEAFQVLIRLLSILISTYKFSMCSLMLFLLPKRTLEPSHTYPPLTARVRITKTSRTLTSTSAANHTAASVNPTSTLPTNSCYLARGA